MDVTLGSLWGESLGVLEGLGWLDDAESSGSSGSASGGEEEEEEGKEVSAARRRQDLRASAARSMSNRSVPFFEEMLEDSRLGKIKRRSGAHVRADGSTVEWTFVELDGEESGDAVMDDRVEAVSAESGNGNKRVRLGH